MMCSISSIGIHYLEALHVAFIHSKPRLMCSYLESQDGLHVVMKNASKF